MKRVLSVVLVIMLLVPVAAMGASDQGIGEYTMGLCKSMIEALVNIYDNNPYLFDADYTFMLYSYYQMYAAAERTKFAELYFNMKTILSASTEIVSDKELQLEKSRQDLSDILVQEFQKWTNKEITSEKFNDLLVNLARIVVESK